MSRLRERAAERLIREIVEHVVTMLPPGLGRRPEVWERMVPADAAMMEAVRRYEAGEIPYDDLEAEGVRYVEAWEAAASPDRDGVGVRQRPQELTEKP